MGSVFGHEDEWAHFSDTHGPLMHVVVEGHKRVLALLKDAQEKAKSEEDWMILAIGLACIKEFEEIVLLCGNGYGSGANKLLRAFYERVVTLSYLVKHPDKIRQFLDFTHVHWCKLLGEARKYHNEAGLRPEEIKQIEIDYQNSKAQFTEDLCKTCGTTRTQGSWTKKPVGDMASDVDDILRLAYFNTYLKPTFMIHTTAFGVMEVLEKTPEGKINLFGRSRQHEMADNSINLAYILLTQAAIAVNAYFQLAQESLLEKIGKDYADVLASQE